jgi:hypothetical protein
LTLNEDTTDVNIILFAFSAFDSASLEVLLLHGLEQGFDRRSGFCEQLPETAMPDWHQGEAFC